jgi:hypothetical protein
VRPIDIEVWALRLLDRQKAGGRLEDARVEAKAAWPADPNKAARRLGGHCNALRGDDALWLIGLDERRGVQAIEPEDFATWWPKIAAEFHGEVPTPTELVIDYEGQQVVALHFSTDRAPYLVRVAGGGKVEREVPWREGTSLRTATRADLLRLLAPLQQVPKVELLSCTVNISSLEKSDKAHVVLEMKLYITAPVGSALVIPEHRCETEVRFPRRGSFAKAPDFTGGPFARYWHPGRDREPDPPGRLISDVDDQLLIQGPGFVRVRAAHEVERARGDRLGRTEQVEVRLTLRAVDLDLPVTVTGSLSPGQWPGANSNEISLGYWCR